jgi:NAD(P)H-dependent FMN reductase
MIGIVGSPRRGGNTDILLEEALRGGRAAGAAIEKLFLSDLEIAPCLGCNACRQAGACVQKDDMPAVLKKMEQSRVWVFGTPVYWWGATAQFKAFLDRWYVGTDVIYRNPGQRVIIIIPFGDTDVRTARNTVGMFEDALRYLKMELFATVLAAGVYERGAIRGHEDVMRKARQVGRDAMAK